LSLLALIQFGILVGALQSVSGRLMFAAIACLIVVNLVELALLYSRSSWPTVGLIVLAAGCLMTSRRQLTRLLVTAGIVTVVGAVLFLTVPTLRYLAATTVGVSVGPASEGYVPMVAGPEARMQLWRRTVRMIADHPAGGVGLGNFQEVFESRYNPELNGDGRRGVHAHNLWLQQFAELGLPGGAIYVALWAVIVWLGWRSARDEPGFVSAGLLLSVVGILGSNLTTNMFFLTGGASGRLQSLTWMLFGLVAARSLPRRLRRFL
jgi:O-antigen ligase